MASDYRIFWSDEALKNLDDILEYLINRWSQTVIDDFKKRLSKQISLIEQNPNLFPISKYNPRLRKAILSKQTTIFYEVSGQLIYIVFLFNNKQDIEKIK